MDDDVLVNDDASYFEYFQTLRLLLLLNTNALVSQTLLVNHIISLVQYKDFHRTRFDLALLDQIHDGTGSSYNNLGIDFLPLCKTILYSSGCGDLCIFCHLRDDIQDLANQLSIGCQANSL